MYIDTITPNHFLIGETRPNQSLGEVSSKEINYHKKSRAVQTAFNMLWIRWKKEYIPTLTQGKGRLLRGRNSKSRDLVILQEENVPRPHWPVDRVIEIYSGRDGVVRTVKRYFKNY